MNMGARPHLLYRIVPFTNSTQGTLYALMTSDYKPITDRDGILYTNRSASILKAFYSNSCHASGITPIEVIDT